MTEKLNIRRTVLIGTAFLSICAFWQMYNNVIPLILTNTFHMNETISGIIIPDSAKEKPLRGEVLAVGDGTKDEKMVLEVGDQVLYGKYAGTELELNNEKFLIMRQSDVLAIVK